MKHYQISVAIKDKGFLFRTDWFDNKEDFSHALDAIVLGFPSARYSISYYTRESAKQFVTLY